MEENIKNVIWIISFTVILSTVFFLIAQSRASEQTSICESFGYKEVTDIHLVPLSYDGIECDDSVILKKVFVNETDKWGVIIKGKTEWVIV